MKTFKIFIFYLIFSCSLLSAAQRYDFIVPPTSGYLKVDELHTIYWEESGNPHGIPVIFLHGGPGTGTDETQRTFFDPDHYRIILFDQRGCGKSLPYGCLEKNTTWDLVDDINRLREFLHVDRALFFGGSWGSTLALTYAIQYPENVLGLILRGIFLCQQEELDWFYKEGAHQLAPEAWQVFRDQIPVEEQEDLISAYHRALQSDSSWKRTTAAASWVLWEFANLHAKPDDRVSALINSRFLFHTFMLLYRSQNLTMASIENHYFFNKGFYESDHWILDNIHRIQEIPGIIVQGENDQICPSTYAQQLHDAWPKSLFFLIPEAGHASDEPGTLEALLNATEYFKSSLHINQVERRDP